METRYSSARTIEGTLQAGYEAATADSQDSIPSCGIEDVDRAFFTLFSERLPLYYKKSKNIGETKRVPVVFASGERFAVLNKTASFRDNNGALILPLISITRNGMEFDSTKQGGASEKIPELVIKRKLSKDDPKYQNIINSAKLKNSKYSPGNGDENMFVPGLSNNIYEFIVIPTPKYYTLKYEVNIWCQYASQLNTIIEVITGAYKQPGNRTIKLDTPKGYWFVAYFESSISQDNNFADYSDGERLLKATLTAEVPAYLILPDAIGIPNGVKRYFSSPKVSFDVEVKNIEKEVSQASANLQSGDEARYILTDIYNVEDDLPKDFIGSTNFNVVQGDVTKIFSNDNANIVDNKLLVKNKNKKVVQTYIDPQTGITKEIITNIVDSNLSKGEEVYKFEIINRQRF